MGLAGLRRRASSSGLKEIHLGPGMQLVFRHLGWVVDRIAAPKRGRQVLAAAGGHKQHGRAAAGAAAAKKRLLGRHWLAIEAAHVLEVVVDAVCQREQAGGRVLLHRRRQPGGPGGCWQELVSPWPGAP